MNVKEKRKALEKYCSGRLCNKCALFNEIKDCTAVTFEDAPDEMIEKWHAMAFPEAEATARPDYEAEYHKLLEENAKLNEECKYLQMNMQELRNENNILNAKLGMVYLIFGGGRNV